MREVSFTGTVTHPARTFGGGAASPVAAAHVPAAQGRAAHPEPFRSVAARLDGTAGDCDV